MSQLEGRPVPLARRTRGGLVHCASPSYRNVKAAAREMGARIETAAMRRDPATGPGPAGLGAAPAGRRLALCVGINSYRQMPLSGCVADARMWSTTLSPLGFECRLLTDGEATREGILSALYSLFRDAREGDVVVFQYAGHGTTVPDLNGDELGGDSPGRDEAIVPVDYHTGALLIDDDIGEAVASARAGVNITFFIDCCHSGTISRFGVGGVVGRSEAVADERSRFLPLDRETVDAYRKFRKGVPALRASRGPGTMREVVFSACLSTQLAWESDGHGEFTLRATKILDESTAYTHEEFQKKVNEAFGPAPRQQPNLDCASEAAALRLLAPLGTVIAPGTSRTDIPAAPTPSRDVLTVLSEGFRLLADHLAKG